MKILIIGILLIIISILLVIYSGYVLQHIHKINTEVDEENKNLLNEKEKICIEIKGKEKELKNCKEQLEDLQNNISKTIDNQKELSQKAFESYCEILEHNYNDYEEEYDTYKKALEDAYSERQLELMKDIDETQKELDKIKSTRAAAIQALTREKEIEEQLSFYCLHISDNELKDIAVLESVKPKLINPRILSMLIWQTYWRTPMTNLCNNVIGKTTKTGIYKITNQKTKECYIGQAVDLASRWKDHAKCGLGIDTPAGNKLYKAMQEYGIWSFSWEVLELCSKDLLNEKEKYYINLYQSKEYGYNSTAGNK